MKLSIFKMTSKHHYCLIKYTFMKRKSHALVLRWSFWAGHISLHSLQREKKTDQDILKHYTFWKPYRFETTWGRINDVKNSFWERYSFEHPLRAQHDVLVIIANLCIWRYEQIFALSTWTIIIIPEGISEKTQYSSNEQNSCMVSECGGGRT